jgi:hypothetical protein
MSKSIVAHAPSSSLAALHLATERMAAPATASVASRQGSHPVLAPPHRTTLQLRTVRIRRHALSGDGVEEESKGTPPMNLLSRDSCELSPFLFHASHWQCSHRFAFSNQSLWFLFFSFCPIYALLKWYQQRRNPAAVY